MCAVSKCCLNLLVVIHCDCWRKELVDIVNNQWDQSLGSVLFNISGFGIFVVNEFLFSKSVFFVFSFDIGNWIFKQVLKRPNGVSFHPNVARLCSKRTSMKSAFDQTERSCKEKSRCMAKEDIYLYWLWEHLKAIK